MNRVRFKVEFLSDVVLPATSNTEGNIEYLDFIPGSNFLGIAASKKYDYENSFEIFHSGKVRFTDATLLKDEHTTYKTPLSYFHEKLDDSIIYNHHFIEDFSKFKQLKQMRNGYITKDKDPVFVEYDYSQKSAYNKDKRKSDDGKMFGYSAIKKGSTWQFYLLYDENIKNIDNIIDSLEGKKRLGKSKSSQYGEVKITKIDNQNPDNHIETTANDNRVFLYAKSRLALFDENGNPSYNLKDIHPGLKDENIVWESSQIRISSFTPYNRSRATKDYERVCINSGSVIVLKNISDEILKDIKNGVGAYLSEGFGEVLINPIFLMDKSFKNKKSADTPSQKKNILKKIETLSNDKTVKFLMLRHNRKIDILDIADSVQDFIDKHSVLYPENMNSQWGAIRAIATKESPQDLINKIKEYISKGVAKDKWSGNRGEELLKAVEKNPHKKEFVRLLSIEMPKAQKGAKS